MVFLFLSFFFEDKFNALNRKMNVFEKCEFFRSRKWEPRVQTSKQPQELLVLQLVTIKLDRFACVHVCKMKLQVSMHSSSR